MRISGAHHTAWVAAVVALLGVSRSGAGALESSGDTPDATPAAAQADQPDAATPRPVTVTCISKPGERIHCPADTSKGVALVRSSGEAPCLLGKTWGYDDRGIWVSDGCGAEFFVGLEAPAGEGAPMKEKSPEYIPNVGFLLYEGENGQIYMRLFSYVRYLNQLSLDPEYTDSFGTVKTVERRQDVQLNKFFLPFSGWFLTPKFRYYLYVWSANPSQGDPAQVVGAGNLSYSFNRFVTLGGGITSLPSVRSTEGQFPYWLGVDDRLIADEFFRGSYTSGLWLKGELATKVKYMVMIANNLSTLGVSASQLDNTLDTTSVMLQWLPTTGEFGLYGTFGDYDYHEKVATRLAVHFTHSTEDEQSQPGTDGIENSQIRLTDGNVIFTPDLFAPGVDVDRVRYEMASVDAGIKYRGFSLEAEYYWRWLSDFEGTGTGIIEDIDDHGYQAQLSVMAVPKVLQAYTGRSEIRGRYGNGSETRVGLNWYVVGKRGLRLNTEWIHLTRCPVGYTAVPYPVGGNGDVYHVNFEMNF
jgi:hypothetical protein